MTSSGGARRHPFTVTTGEAPDTSCPPADLSSIQRQPILDGLINRYHGATLSDDR
jgi:hypothetical protein